MEDKSLYNSQQRQGISANLQNYIDSMVEEIVLEGKPFDTQKKYLKKFSEKEELDYEKLEADINTFIEILDSLRTAFSKLLVEHVEGKGRECYISEDTLQKLVKYSSQPKVLKKDSPLPEKKPLDFKYLLYGIVGVIVLGIILLVVLRSLNNNVPTPSPKYVPHDTIFQDSYNSDSLKMPKSTNDKFNDGFQNSNSSTDIQKGSKTYEDKKNTSNESQQSPKREVHSSKQLEKEAKSLVKEADEYFANGDYEYACQKYIEANKIYPGMGNGGVEKFSKLAMSLSEDKEAPAYKKCIERASRIERSSK